MNDRLVIQPQPSVMSSSQHFSVVPKAEIERSTFDRSHGWKGTFDAGLLIPVLVDEMLPGDTFHCNMSIFARLATPLKAPMDNMFLDSFFFFVPYRLIFREWQQMCGEQVNPGDSTDFETPTISGPFNVAVGDLADYFGIPLGTISAPISALPFRAYNLIWNQWFRDENLQNSLGFGQDQGPDPIDVYTLRRRGKRKDYFTGALPWPQKGAAVQIPIGGRAQVFGDAPVNGSYNDGTNVYNMNQPMSLHFNGSTDANIKGVFPTYPYTGTVDVTGLGLWADAGQGGLYADLSSATSQTINALRQAFQLQRLLERDARGGTRYTEIVRSHFGVISPDARLQRPEFLGGGETPININPVAATAQGSANLGDLASFGTVASSGGHGFTYSSTEHGVVLGLISVRADLTYQNGIDRMWMRRTRWDYYWPALAHLGEQAIAADEIFAGAGDGPWGYQERYAEYRYKPSRITGLFRSNAPDPLDVWHLSQNFTALPNLNGEFIQDNPPVDRIIAVPSQPHFIADVFFRYRCARPMPIYSVPGLIDHF